MCKSCGNLRSVCGDPTINWYPHAETCWATATRDWGQRRLQEKFKAENPGPDELGSLDGVAVWAGREPPEVDDFA